MTEKVSTQMEEIYNKGRTAKNLIPQGLLPDLGWKTDQQEEERQLLPVEKQRRQLQPQQSLTRLKDPQAVDSDQKQNN